MNQKGVNTKCVHAGTYICPETQGVNSPIFTSTSFKVELGLAVAEAVYPRYINTQNHLALSKKIAALENGEYAFVTSSGMAAITTAVMACLQAGDHVIFQKQVYGGTYNFVAREIMRYGIEVSWIDADDIINELKQNIKANTKLVYIESPSNPLLSIVDIQEITELTKAKNIICAIDNTFATPINQNPLELGVDIVVHSGTKYFGGHSDLLCGAIATSSSELAKLIEEQIKNHGPILDSIACYLLERSLKTLAIRVERQCQNAKLIAEFLDKHPKVAKVNYPGLKSFAGHEVANKQMKDFGAMLSFEVIGDLENCKKFAGKLQLIDHAISLGGVESIISIPCIASHAKMTADECKKAGITENLVRLSVGIEDAQDLINDLDQALN